MEKEEGEWTTPTRTGRSPGKGNKGLAFGQVTILSNSRFSVLSEENNEEEAEKAENAEGVTGKVVEQKSLTMDTQPNGMQVEMQSSLVAGRDNLSGSGAENIAETKAEKSQLERANGVKEVGKDVPVRQQLPRNSKNQTNQKAMDANPSGLNKRSTRKNH